MGTPDRFSSMSVPERLSVDGGESRVRKESDKSNASENMMVPDKLTVSDVAHPYALHLETPPKVLTMGNFNNRRQHLTGSQSVPNFEEEANTVALPSSQHTKRPIANLEENDDIITLANRILTLHQKVLNLEAQLNKTQDFGTTDSVLNYIKMFGVSLASAIIVQYIMRR